MRIGVAACLLALGLTAQEEFLVRDGDRVLVQGEAVQGSAVLTTYVQAYVASRMSESNVAWLHAPWQAGSADPDVVAFRPTVVVWLFLGGTGPGEAQALANLRELKEHAPALRLTCVDDARFAPRCAGIAKALAETAPVATAAAAGSGEDQVSAAILKAWRASPVVLSVELDVAAGSFRGAENTTPRDLSADEWVGWSQDDRAVPMALEPRAAAMAAFNQHLLKVFGLRAPRYRLTIDGKGVGTFWREQYEHGLDLAALPTPLAAQAQKVHQRTLELNGVHLARWMYLQLPLVERKTQFWQANLAELAEQERAILEQRAAAAQPKTHDYELQPVENGTGH